MRTIAIAVAAGILTLGLSIPLSAQTPPEKSATKVYSYKKTNPNLKRNTAEPQQKATEHVPSALPYGSPKWWEEMQRISGGDGGSL